MNTNTAMNKDREVTLSYDSSFFRTNGHTQIAKSTIQKAYVVMKVGG